MWPNFFRATRKPIVIKQIKKKKGSLEVYSMLLGYQVDDIQKCKAAYSKCSDKSANFMHKSMNTLFDEKILLTGEAEEYPQTESIEKEGQFNKSLREKLFGKL